MFLTSSLDGGEWSASSRLKR